MKADIIVKKQRKQRLYEKLQTIEADAHTLFSEESSLEMIEAYKKLIGYIKQHHTPEKVQSLMEKMKSMDSIPLDSNARKAFDQCILNLEALYTCRYRKSEIQDSLQKLVMDAKFKAMKMTNECKALEKKMKILMLSNGSSSSSSNSGTVGRSSTQQQQVTGSSLIVQDDNDTASSISAAEELESIEKLGFDV